MQRASITPYISGAIKKNKGKSRFVNDSIKIKSNGANGIGRINSQTERVMRNNVLDDLARRIGYFELVWYPVFIVLDLLCLFVAPLSFFLVFNVVQLLLCMTANNLAARGNRWGLLLFSISLVMYCYISYVNKVWGEVIINVVLYIPLEMIGFFRWKKASGGEAVIPTVDQMSKKKLMCVLFVFVGMIASIFSLLHFGLKQEFAIVNAISISACLIGDYCRNNRYIETWYFFMACNIAGITLWLLEIFFAGGEGVGLEVLPMVVSFSSTLTNNFNGLNIWAKIKKRTMSTDSVYLAKRKVNIGGIAKLNKEQKSFVCKETEDVIGLKFRANRKPTKRGQNNA